MRSRIQRGGNGSGDQSRALVACFVLVALFGSSCHVVNSYPAYSSQSSSSLDDNSNIFHLDCVNSADPSSCSLAQEHKVAVVKCESNNCVVLAEDNQVYFCKRISSHRSACRLLPEQLQQQFQHIGEQDQQQEKRALPFDSMNYGKRALPFDSMNYGKKRALPFETLNYGKRASLPFDSMNFGKKRAALPFDSMNYGKRSSLDIPIDGYIIGKRGASSPLSSSD